MLKVEVSFHMSLMKRKLYVLRISCSIPMTTWSLILSGTGCTYHVTTNLRSTKDRFRIVIQTGKLQPVLIWREKPVLLALLSNLTIPVPA